MPDTKNAFVTTPFDLANTETSYMEGAVIKDMAANQFTDLEGAGLVREATADEVTAAQVELAPVHAEPEGD